MGISIKNRLQPTRRVTETTLSLTARDGTIRTTVPINAARNAGVDVEDPEPVGAYYLKDEGLLVLDLGGNYE